MKQLQVNRGAPMTKLLDTHQHLLYRDRLSYAWADGLPALARQSFTLADYQRLTAGRGVAGTLFMEADAGDYRAETRSISALMREAESGLLGIISSCRPESDGFTGWLDECADLPVVGFRRILHEVSDDVSQGETFRANLRRLTQADLPFDLVYRADQLPLAVELAQACPDVQFVLDHCGVPDIAGGGFEPWAADLARIAQCANVVCKISGVLAYCAPEDANVEAIRPYVQHVIDSFTPARCLWGSDWPVVNLTADLPEWIAAFRTLTADLSDAERAAICHGTAERIYGVKL